MIRLKGKPRSLSLSDFLRCPLVTRSGSRALLRAMEIEPNGYWSYRRWYDYSKARDLMLEATDRRALLNFAR
jgi:hypothetical protein